MTKTKTKTKSLTKNAVSFPANGWAYDMEYVAELPNFFENPAWREPLLIPPPPGPDETAKELEKLLEMQKKRKKRERRKPDILLEDSPYDVAKMLRLMMLGQSGAYPNSYLLMQAMITLGKVVVVHYKREFMRPRPSQLEPRLRPLIDIPGHPAYPSGHATQMHLAAKALATVVRSHEIGEQLFAEADRIAENREWAGVHYPSDSAAGKLLAERIFPMALESYRETFRKAAREWL